MQKTAYELRISDWSSDVCSSDLDYAGDVAVDEAWHVLGSDGKAVLVDVRTRPEWQFVGIPDLSGMGKQVAAVSWQAYPDMDRNPQFEDAVRAAAPSSDTPIYFRSEERRVGTEGDSTCRSRGSAAN